MVTILEEKTIKNNTKNLKKQHKKSPAQAPSSHGLHGSVDFATLCLAELSAAAQKDLADSYLKWKAGGGKADPRTEILLNKRTIDTSHYYENN